MPRSTSGGQLGQRELIAFLALSMALTALGIDFMLPAFGDMRRDLGLPEGSTAIAGIVTAYFVGLAVGTVVYGPLSDHFGRKATLLTGYGVYGLGAALSTLAPSLGLLLVARFIWGLGAAGPRVITLAIVRDTFEGERMSRTMSLVMAIFLVVPVLSPGLAALALLVVPWRALFAVCILAVTAAAVWARRLAETLADEHRLDLSFARLGRAARVVVSDRITVGYMLALTALYGVFTSYLASAENIFATTFDEATRFPLWFGLLASVQGAGMLLNARVVERTGVRRLAHGMLLAYVAVAAAFAVAAALTGGRPPLWGFLLAIAGLLSTQALLIPNFNTIAMQPMAAVAGTAAAVIGATQIAVGALLGSVLDRTFDGSVLPISLGFLGYGLLALALVTWAERGRLFQPIAPPLATEPDEPDETGPPVA